VRPDVANPLPFAQIIAHCLMLLSLCSEDSASISGRPCCTLSATYAHALLAHILSPQLTKKRCV